MITIEYLRQFRIGQFAIFDTTAAYAGILILSPVLTWMMQKLNVRVPVTSWLWFTLPLSVISHIIFRQPTSLIKILANPKDPQFYIAGFILFGMVYMGFRKVTKIG